jgi:hypothetical protein
LRQGGGNLGDPWDNTFFYWWSDQVVAIEDYPYTGIDYHNNQEMPIPPNSSYKDIGIKYFLNYLIFIFYINK